ncbi:hypothetical protein H5T55_05860 [Candidatus Bipolaricaulota bacterium]|nr:hypothetical protein [Candidatus Bipolaricaulota bacterium]
MGTLREIAYHYLGPYPVIFYLGIVGYAFLLATAGAMGLSRVLKKRRPVKVHRWLASVTLLLATLHALLGIATRIQDRSSRFVVRGPLHVFGP